MGGLFRKRGRAVNRPRRVRASEWTKKGTAHHLVAQHQADPLRVAHLLRADPVLTPISNANWKPPARAV